jgi:hypothetical protein
MLLLFFVGIGFGTYYFAASLFKVEYTKSGFQVNLPGRTVYYVPVLPMYDWQDTGVRLKRGDDYDVEIVGYASTASWGLLIQGLGRTLQDTDLSYRQKIDILDHLPDAQGFAGPGGIPATAYTGDCPSPKQLPPQFGGLPEEEQQKEFERRITLKLERTRSTKRIEGYGCFPYSSEAPGLVVRGLPHNTIVGIIQDPTAGDPKDGPNAYSWEQKDKEGLVNLSSDKYPVPKKADRSGSLWVVVNDAAGTRWDNTGMFILSIRVYTTPFTPR